MHLVTKQALIDNIAEEWKSRYLGRGRWLSSRKLTYKETEQVYYKLLNKDEEEIINLLGEGHVRYRCSYCQNLVESAVELDFCICEEEVYMCFDCINKAAKLQRND